MPAAKNFPNHQIDTSMISATLDTKERSRARAAGARSLARDERQLCMDLGVPEFLFKITDVRRLRPSLERDWARVRRD